MGYWVQGGIGTFARDPNHQQVIKARILEYKNYCTAECVPAFIDLVYTQDDDWAMWRIYYYVPDRKKFNRMQNLFWRMGSGAPNDLPERYLNQVWQELVMQPA
jgi:hypothetical protein